MLISFPCRKCQTVLEVEAAAVGSDADCPECGTAQPIPKVEIGPGVTLAGFRIEKPLAAGGMGKVFLARQLSMDRQVALKILPAQFAMDPEDVQRFLNEARILAKLEHPNIVPAHEAGDDGGVYFLAMAYVRGDGLDRHIRKHGPMTEHDALAMARKIAAALAYAWNRHRVVHRDVKPENILLDETGEPRLTDMGLSKCMGHGAAITLAGSVMGTPNYMSPEQMDDLSAADVRSDIFSLGMTLHHMLTGQVPFEGSTVVKTFQRVATQSLPDPRTLSPRVSAHCVTLLEKMLAKDPAHRYPTWEAVLEDLDRVQAGQPPRHAPSPSEPSILRRQDAPPPAAPAHPRPTGGKPRPPTVHLTVTPHHPHPASAPAPRPTRRVMPAIVAASAALLLVGLGLGLLERQQSRKRALDEQARQAQEAAREQEQARDRIVRDALAYADAHPEDYDGSLRRLSAASQSAAGTDDEARTRTAIDKIRAARQQEVARELAALKRKVATLAAAGRIDEAIAAAGDGAAPLAADTAEERRLLVASLEEKRRTRESESQRLATLAHTNALVRVARVTDELAAHLLRGDMASAATALQAAEKDPALQSAATEWGIVRNRCKAVLDLPPAILKTFRDSIGRTVLVELKTGPEPLLIEGVTESGVVARQKLASGASIEKRFGLAELSAAERLKRLGADTSGEGEIMRGILAIESRSYETARQSFARASCPIATAMAQGVDRMAAAQAESQAGQARAVADQAAAREYRTILQALDLETEPDDVRGTIAELSDRKVGDLTLRKAKEQVRLFRTRHGQSGFAHAHEAVLALIEKASPGAERMGPNAAQAAMDRLKAANPGMTTNPKPQFFGKEIALDLSKDAAVADISALAGLPIRSLKLDGTHVGNLEPLKGMPLKELNLANCGFLTDLTPLRGLPLTYLNLANIPAIREIAPLEGMPLEELYLSGAPITDITPLAKARLRYLNLRTCKMKDLSPLAGQPLEHLDIGYTPVADLSPLVGMPLATLVMDLCPSVTDLSPLKGLPLKTLNVRKSGATDFTPVRGIKTLTTFTQ